MNSESVSFMMFAGCKNLYTFVGENVKVIESNAFSNCSSLKKCVFSNKYVINSRAFYKSGVEEFDLRGADFIGYGHFELCKFLRILIFSNYPVDIPSKFCFNCEQLRLLTTKVVGRPGHRVIHEGKVKSLIYSPDDDSSINIVNDLENQ